MLAHLLGNNDPEVLATFLQKIADKDAQYTDRLGTTLRALAQRDDRFLVVIPKYGDTDFCHALLQGLVTALDRQGIDYRPATVYNRAAEVLTTWKTANSSNYSGFREKLNSKSIDDFIDLLRNLDPTAYQQFKIYFRELIGTSFSETDTADAYTAYAQTAAYIARLGYRGIVVCYDEFGDMLRQMINQKEGPGLVVQEFLQSIKRANSQANILFLAATHQNPEALRDNKEEDISKITGRFDIHRLGVTRSSLEEAADAEIADATEIIGTVFIHPPATKPQFDRLLTADHRVEAIRLAQKHKLYPGKSDDWIEINVLNNTHPLHVLTARLLPRLSNEFAQNTRSMFNFLSPTQTEAGALCAFLNSSPPQQPNGRPTLFTPDRLLGFFEPALREAKFGQIRNWLDDYLTAVGRVTGQTDVERLFRNLLLLKVVRDSRFAPTGDLLFWAMDWPASRRQEFDDLLRILHEQNQLEHYKATDTYDFPSAGALSVDAVIDEERSTLAGLSLAQCLPVWEALEQRQVVNYIKPGQINRWLKTLTAHRLTDIIHPIEELRQFYHYQTDAYNGSGLVFYLIEQSQANLDLLVSNGVIANALTRPYTFYATPKDLLVFSALIKRTVEIRARELALDRDEIKLNQARKDKISGQLRSEREALKTALKRLYEPINWNWYYAGEPASKSFNSPRHLDRWLEQHMETLFPMVPLVKDEALEFVKRTQKRPERQNALASIMASDRNRIEMDGPGNAPNDRIVRNFFRNLSLTSTQGGRSDKKQYGEVKSPDSSTPEGAIFKHFDKVFKANPITHPADLFVPLLQSPFGLSEHLIKFFFVAYNRLNDAQISIQRGTLPQQKTSDVIEVLFAKPGDYRIRYVALSAPEERYLTKLRGLFDKKNASSFSDIVRQFQGVWSPLTPLQRTLISQKGGDVSSFYGQLDELGRQPIIPEKEARTLFLDTLPNSLLGITSQADFVDDRENVERIIDKLTEIKRFPETAERQFWLETLQTLSARVFGQSIVEKDDLKAVVKSWFDALPSANKIAHYETPAINDWLKYIQYGGTAAGRDILATYLADLPSKTINNWNSELAICRSELIEEFKGYKKAVEDFTRPVLPVYQAIARGIFDVPASDCPTEAAFAALFSDWYMGLPLLTREHDFGDETTRWFMQNVTSTAPTRQTFLDVIPRRWLEKGHLPTTVSVDWEQWTDSDTSAVANQYRARVDQVTAWKPPVSEADFFGQIGQVFGLSGTTTADVLRDQLLTNWLPTLPARTREAGWVGMKDKDDKANWMVHLQQSDEFYRFLTDALPKRYSLPTLRQMNDDYLFALLLEIETIKQDVDRYRRPLTEVLGTIEKQKFQSEGDFKEDFYYIIRKTEAFSSVAEKDSQLLAGCPLHSLVLRLVRENSPVSELIGQYAAACNGIESADHHQWTPGEQTAFTRSFRETKKELVDWCFPEDRLMGDARAQLSKQLQIVCEQFNLTLSQRIKILNDLLAEHPANVPS